MIKRIKRIVLIFVCGLGCCECYSQAPPGIQWEKSYGGTNNEKAYSIHQTSDNGYIIGGITWSDDGDVSGIHGVNADYWVVKTDSMRNIQWQKCLGGSLDDIASSVQQTMDGGYIVVGYTRSMDGDVIGSHGQNDFWIVKLNIGGTIQWQKCLGGTDLDNAFSIQQTFDGGYIVAGETISNDGDVNGNNGDFDFWIVKLDDAGTIQWQKCYGGTDYDRAFCIRQTSDGGYIIAGETFSNDVDVDGNHGNNDYWVLKIDSSSVVQWQKCIGGTNDEQANSIQETTDGGYIVTGSTLSNDSDVYGKHGSWDCWMVKLNNSGNIQWQKCLGGTGLDFGFSCQQNNIGEYVVAGLTFSNDGDVNGNHGFGDFWIINIDSLGIFQWQKCLGGSGKDVGLFIQQTTDEGYIASGLASSIDGDVTGNHGGNDFWIVKFASDSITSVHNLPSSASNLQLFPN